MSAIGSIAFFLRGMLLHSPSFWLFQSLQINPKSVSDWDDLHVVVCYEELLLYRYFITVAKSGSGGTSSGKDAAPVCFKLPEHTVIQISMTLDLCFFHWSALLPVLFPIFPLAFTSTVPRSLAFGTTFCCNFLLANRTKNVNVITIHILVSPIL